MMRRPWWLDWRVLLIALRNWLDDREPACVWSFRMGLRNAWRRRVRFRGEDCDRCWMCALDFPSRWMRAYCERNGNEARICSRCLGFATILDFILDGHRRGAVL